MGYPFNFSKEVKNSMGNVVATTCHKASTHEPHRFLGCGNEGNQDIGREYFHDTQGCSIYEWFVYVWSQW